MNSIFHRISVRKYEDRPVEKEKIMEILKGMHRSGETLILITHDNGIAAQAKRVVRIMDGKIESDMINEEFVEEA